MTYERFIWTATFLLTLLGLCGISDAARAQSGRGTMGIATASPPEQLAFVQDVRAEVGQAERELTRMLDQQRKNDDPNAVECLTTRLTSVQALSRVLETAQTSLVGALAAGAEERSTHELRKVTVAMTKTRSLLGEAQRCAAGQRFELGSTTTDVSQDEALTSNDAFVVPEFSDLDTNVDPPQVSPFL